MPGISYSTNVEEVRRLLTKYNKTNDNSEKLEIAHRIEPLKISHGVFPSDWENVGKNQKKATIEKSMLIFESNNQYLCCYFKRDTIITYDNIGVTWENEDDLLDVELRDQIPLR